MSFSESAEQVVVRALQRNHPVGETNVTKYPDDDLVESQDPIRVTLGTSDDLNGGCLVLEVLRDEAREVLGTAKFPGYILRNVGTAKSAPLEGGKSEASHITIHICEPGTKPPSSSEEQPQIPSQPPNQSWQCVQTTVAILGVRFEENVLTSPDLFISSYWGIVFLGKGETRKGTLNPDWRNDVYELSLLPSTRLDDLVFEIWQDNARAGGVLGTAQVSGNALVAGGKFALPIIDPEGNTMSGAHLHIFIGPSGEPIPASVRPAPVGLENGHGVENGHTKMNGDVNETRDLPEEPPAPENEEAEPATLDGAKETDHEPGAEVQTGQAPQSSLFSF